MATTISSGRANSPKLTANIADHGIIYGGRGLIFDGVSDYLDCGNNSIFSFASTEPFSISAWVYYDTTATRTIIGKGSASGSDYEWRLFTDGSSHLNFALYNPTASAFIGRKYSSAITTGSWHHISATYNGGTACNGIEIYLNGIAVSDADYASGSFSGMTNNNANVIIGKYTNYFDGKISDVKLFNTTLTEAQVQEFYLKPEQSAPSAIQDNLIAWYPMCEGNPDSPQSIVYDHSEKKLGANIVDSNTENHWGSYGGNVSNTTDGIKIEYGGGSSNGGYVTLEDAKILKDNLEVGATYVFTVDGYYEGGSSGSKLELYAGRQLFTDTFTETRTSYEIRFQATSATGDFIRGYGMSAGNTIYFENMSLKKILMGNHATTNFFGDELIANGDFSANANNWTAGNSATLSINSGGQSGFSLKVTTGGESNPEARSDAMTVVANTTYQLTFYHKDSGGTGTQPYYAVYDVSNSGYITSHALVSPSSSSGSWTQQTHSFVTPSGCTSIKVFLRSTATTGNHFYFDTVRLKQVGVSSAGFATADSEPTIPQVPLLRYNEKMLFDGVNDNVNLGTVSVPTDYPLTISAWIIRRTGSNPTVQEAIFSANAGWQLALNTSSNIRFEEKGSGTQAESVYSISDTKLHHIAVTVNTSNTVTYYRDGVQLDTDTYDQDISSGQTWYIGQNGGSGGYFNGLIDEVSVWNDDLDSTQIQEIFNDGVALDATTHSKAPTNLVGYWRNDGISSWTDRRGWSYLDFDGSGDFIQLPMTFSYTVHSISIWYNDDGGDRYLFDARDTSNSGITVAVNAGTGTIWYAVRGSYTNSFNSNTFSAPFNNWNHVLVTYDGSTAKIYVNGSEVGSSSFTDTISTTTNARIGRQAWTSGGDFNGGIASVGLYTTAKSASEAQAIYNQGLTGSEATNSGIFAYYKLDTESTSSGAVKDLVGTNHGTVNGNPTLNTGNNGTPAGTPEAITIREGLNSNKDGLGFPFKNDDRNTLRLSQKLEHLVVPYTKGLSATSISDAITVECWVKFHDHPSGYNVIAGNSTGGSWTNGWALAMVDNELRFAINDYNANKATYTITDFTKWYHIVATYDRSLSSDNIAIYVDLVKGTSDDYTTAIGESNKDLHIGYLDSEGAGVKAETCLIDELKVYNRVLTGFKANGTAVADTETVASGEIAKNYKHGKGKHKND